MHAHASAKELGQAFRQALRKHAQAHNASNNATVLRTDGIVRTINEHITDFRTGAPSLTQYSNAGIPGARICQHARSTATQQSSTP
jgi:hypothetical protein